MGESRVEVGERDWEKRRQEMFKKNEKLRKIKEKGKKRSMSS